MPLPMTDALILDGDSSFAHAVAVCLAESPGLRLHAISDASRAPLRFSRHCASFGAHAGGDARRLEAVRGAVRRTGAQVALPMDMAAIRWAAKNREALASVVALPPLPDLDAFDTVSDKWRMACFLGRHGLPHPPTRLAAAGDGGPADLAGVCFPIVLTPRDGANGSGIRRFDTPDALREHLSGLGWETSRYLIQGLIPGENMDCSVLCERGRVLAHTVQRRFLPPMHPFGPSIGVQFLEHPGVMAVVGRLMDALGWSGIANLDLIVAPDGTVSILEVNPRFWGSVLASLAAGVNFPLLSCQAALGVAFPVPPYAPVRFVIKHRHWSPFPRLARRRRPDPPLSDLTLEESVWRYTLRDPLPGLYHLLRRKGVR